MLALSKAIQEVSPHAPPLLITNPSPSSLSHPHIKQKKREYYLKNREPLKALHHLYYINHKDDIKRKKREYYLAHREAVKHSQRQYRVEHKEAIRSSKRRYRAENREAIKAAQRLYREAHREAAKALQKDYRTRNKEAIKHKRRLYLSKAHPRKFKTWTDPTHVRAFLTTATSLLHVGGPLDWYRVSRVQICELGGARLYSVFGNLGRALKFAFPLMDWDVMRFSFKGKKSRQRWLKVVLKMVLPQETDLFEDFLHPKLFWGGSGCKMELDIWVPRYNIALEYQGEHHYHDFCVAYGPSGTQSLYSQRDSEKKLACAKEGITLITIPYWWDGKKESLASTLYQVCPEIFPETNLPQIPISPPSPSKHHLRFKGNRISTFLMHGQVWNKQDPTGWIMSEKLDGFRAFWDGTKLYSRNGSVFPVPSEFTQSFPSNVCLDGELWTGYDFNKLHSILRASCNLQNSPKLIELWKNVQFCVFDAPMHPGNYFERHSFAMQSISHCGPNITTIPIAKCLGFTHLQDKLNEITSKQGEGIILYHPSAKYTSGRTNNIFKVKTFEEEDVKFIRVQPNSYSFLCEQKNGVECVVKCSGWDYSFPPSPGAILTVKYHGLFESSQKMKYPFLLKVHPNPQLTLIS